MEFKNNCSACLMPFKSDKNHKKNCKFCSHCTDKNGNFTFKGNLKEFKEECYKIMRDCKMNYFKAKFFTFMLNFAPYWKNKK